MTAAGPGDRPLFAACLPGLEPLLAHEVTALGAVPEVRGGGVSFVGDRRLVMAANLRLGTASHVLLRCAEFACRALGELERKAADLPWAQWLRPDVALEVRATARRSRVYHTKAIEERIGAAIARSLGAAPPPALAEEGAPCARVAVRFDTDRCSISLDTATSPLHRRGYRLQTAKAPLREDIAHALVLASRWRPGTALLDPFCGSGTVAIEAAMIALGIPPGHLRPPALAHTALWDASDWQAVLAAVPPAPDHGCARISASDRDAGAIAAAQGNAQRAGVSAALELRCCAFAAHPWLTDSASAPPEGVLVTNPPFGLRVQGGKGLVPLYQTIGHRLGRLGPKWRLALLAADPRLARRTGVELRVAFTTDHGGLAVTALVSEPAS